MFSFIFHLILILSLFRSTGKRFDVAYGATGCLASGLCMIFLGLGAMSIALLLPSWADLIPANAQNGLGLMLWFLALCFGGYIAAQLGFSTGWTNSLIVGLFAESFLFAMLLDKLIKPDLGDAIGASQQMQVMFLQTWAYWGRLPGRLFDHLIEMLQEPLTNWQQQAGLFFAIPVAVLGGFLWQWSHPTPPQIPSDTVPQKPLTLMNKILGLRFPILALVILCLLVLAIVFRNDPAIVKAIKERGGRVKGEPVVSVAFPSSASVSDADLKLLKELTSLKTLNIDSTNITDEGLKELEDFSTLESLTLSNTKITDAGLKQFKAAHPGIRVIKN